MIYELAIALKNEASEEAVKHALDSIKSAITDFNGELVMENAWGKKRLAQPSTNGDTHANYFYFMYIAKDGSLNPEIERRIRISETIFKFMFVNIGEDSDVEECKKAYIDPNSAASGAGVDLNKDRKSFSKRKSCWFSAKKTAPNWKDPSSYSWLVNEFGKISPARVTGLRPKYQRMATSAIKRGRCMGLISYISNHTVR